MKRKSTLYLALVLAMTLVISTIAAPVPTGTPDTVEAQDGVEITIWMTGSEDDANILQNAAAPWEAATGNTVIVEPVDWGTAHAQILTAATSGEGPDIITGGLSWGIEFGELGGMIDLRAEFGDDVDALEAVANPAIWSSIESVDGSVYGVPYDLTTYLMFYRPDILAELGFDGPPTNWGELVAIHSAIRTANGEGGFGIGWGNVEWLGFSNFLYQAGGNFYDEECNVTIDSDAGLAAMSFFSTLYRDLGLPSEATPNISAGLDSGLYPVGFEGNWILPSLDASYPDMAGQWEIALLPAGPSGNNTAFLGGRIIGVMSFSPNVEAAFDFIQYLYTEEGVKAIIEEAFNVNMLYIPPQTEFQQFMAVDDEKREVVMAQVADTQGPPNCPGWEESAGEFQLLLEQVILEGYNPEFALEDTAEIMNEYLAAYEQ